MTKPLIIAIEGPDKVGKATQTRLLSSRLWTEGLTTLTVEVPINDGIFYDRIYAMLKDGSAMKYPEAFQAFQVANRLAWQKTAPLHRYDVILFDRWNVSSWVYGRASGLSETFFQTIMHGMLEPDCVVVLDGVAMGEAEDTYEADRDLRAKVRKQYRWWAEEHGAPIVAANDPRDLVHKSIWYEVQKYVTDLGRSQ